MFLPLDRKIGLLLLFLRVCRIVSGQSYSIIRLHMLPSLHLEDMLFRRLFIEAVRHSDAYVFSRRV